MAPDEPYDGDWSLVDLTDGVAQLATEAAHQRGLNFEEFMLEAITEKLERMRAEGETPVMVDNVRVNP